MCSNMRLCLLVLSSLVLSVSAIWEIKNERFFRENFEKYYKEHKIDPRENTKEYWFEVAQNILDKHRTLTLNKNIAKNVILFMGDGMSVATTTLARIYVAGEKGELSFEKFPFTGMLKTYCLNALVPESSCTAGSYLTGVKTNLFTFGVTGNANIEDCAAEKQTKNQATSIARWSQLENKRTGFVTTTRVTHASVAALYASSVSRNHESDLELFYRKTFKCKDIAKQLIRHQTGKGFNVIMGGGSSKLLPNNKMDVFGVKGHRRDGLDLIQEWINGKDRDTSRFIWNRRQLLDLDDNVENVMGLYSSSHLKFHFEEDKSQPTLEEMTEAAIKILSKGDDGFMLFVEGGLIDAAHHNNWAKAAVDETAELDKAVKKALEMTSEEDTLIVVMSDHSHSLSFSGDILRGDTFKIAKNLFPASDMLPITSITYTSGPGYRREHNGKRHDLSKDKFGFDYAYPALFPKEDSNHGGEDVVAYARGPWSHLFSGVIEQNAVPHFLGFASCVGEGRTACGSKRTGSSNSALNLNTNFCLVSFLFLFVLLLRKL